MLTFKEDKHQYFWDGVEVPGITHILKTVGLSKPYDNVDPYYRDRGKAVHKAIELDIQGDLDLSTLHEDCVPYFKAWKGFVKKTKYSPLLTEKRLYSKSKRYACTIDNYGTYKKKHLLVEIKCTENSDKASDLQLCGQEFALIENDFPVELKLVLELHKDESFTPIVSETPKIVWGGVMDLYEWKLKKRNKNSSLFQ